jgi:hypothetical protein
VLVQQHAQNERERVATEQVVGGGVLSDTKGRYTAIVPQVGRGALARRPGRLATTMREIETAYLVVGAGASAMAFVDALLTETDARVVMVNHRHWPGGLWLDAYPFVRLHRRTATAPSTRANGDAGTRCAVPRRAAPTGCPPTATAGTFASDRRTTGSAGWVRLEPRGARSS